ncbi:MAG: low molecular weight protein arginine phosphatase [Clostridia bacterium]|nr:low molecular weight protein arginine phosphatase [Clostridia bacterium]
METVRQVNDISVSPFPAFPEKTEDRPLRVLFVCTGNTCRSPMAAAWLNSHGKAHGIEASSAGLFPAPGSPISPNAVEALKLAGVEPSPDDRFDLHTARPVDEATLRSYDRIVGISRRHAMELIYSYPAHAGKICAMPRDIPDPFGGSVEDYSRCLAEIAAGLKEMFLLDV